MVAQSRSSTNAHQDLAQQREGQVQRWTWHKAWRGRGPKHPRVGKAVSEEGEEATATVPGQNCRKLTGWLSGATENLELRRDDMLGPGVPSGPGCTIPAGR